MRLKEFLTTAATPALVQVIRAAIGKAETGGTQTHLSHLADALLDDSLVKTRLNEASRQRAKASMAQQLLAAPVVEDSSRGTLAFELEALAEPARKLAHDWGAERVAPLTFLATCLSAENLKTPGSAQTQEALRTSGLTLDGLMPNPERESARADFTFQSLGFGTDLTAMARVGSWPTCPLIGLERELRRLITLVSSGTDSVVLVGEPGVGKSALVYGLAWHIAHGTRPFIPTEMESWTIVMISAVNVLSGTGGRGELEERLEKMLTFFRKNPTVVPFFDEVHTLLDTDDATARSVATAIKPPMAAGQFHCIGATTDREYARYIANDEAMNSRFTKILIPEPDAETCATIIGRSKDNLLRGPARELGVTLADDAVRTAIRLTSTYQRSDRLPRKAIRLIQGVVAEKVYQLRMSPGAVSPIVTGPEVGKTFSDTTGIPIDDLDDDRAAFYSALTKKLSARVFGQPGAIEAVTGWLGLQSQGWLDQRRPRGRFLFLGPPGVGKTELALQIAEEVMKDRGSLVTKNMAEYRGEGARNRFMGADPGYVGYGQVPTIYSRVMMRPYSVVVLDEFEKADPSLCNPLLSVLDGQAEDSQARAVDFSQCIFVLTSNAITDGIEGEFSEEALRRHLIDAGGIWQPPLVDRIDRIVLFRPLDQGTQAEILDSMVARRKKAASRSLPAAIDDPAERERILAWANEGEGRVSARRLERALLRWLTESSEQGAGMSSNRN